MRQIIAAPLHIFIFCSTLVVYNAHHLIKKSVPGMAGRHIWSQQYRRWHYILFSVGVIGATLSLWHLPFRIWILSAVSGALGFAYTLPLLPFKSVRYIRQVGWAKIIVLAGVWTIVTAAMPIVYHEISVSLNWFLLAVRFVFIFVLCLAFDIRDMRADRKTAIDTLPNILGKKNTYHLIDVLLLLYILIGMIAQFYSLSVPHILSVIIVAALSRLAIWFAGKYPSDRKYLGLVDGMMLVQAVLIMFYV